MQILTVLTKRSVREIEKERKFLRFYSIKNFQAGDMIETIEANKKSPAIILKSEPASNFKEEIRSGQLEIKKLRFSSTGEYAKGTVIANFPILTIKKYLKNPNLAQENDILRNFFPKKRKAKILNNPSTQNKKEKTGVFEISDLLSKNGVPALSKEKTYHNEMQEIVDTIRTYFNEKAVYGQGSFPYYIGMFKQVSYRDIWQAFGEAKQSKDKNLFQKKKIFWYKIGKYIRGEKPKSSHLKGENSHLKDDGSHLKKEKYK